MTIHPDNLIPPDSELGQLLMQWSESQDTRTWNIARLTNDLIAELEGTVATKADIYKAIAVRCKGKRPDTIRRWAELETDFSREIQDQYKELLSFDHFKIARRLFQDGLTPSIDYALQWAVQGNDDKITAGKFHTVGEVLNNFLPDEAFQNQLLKAWNKSKERLYDLWLIHDNDTDRAVLLRAWKDIEGVIRGLDKTE